ncbi:uncharacterized protein BJ212DRAFT_1436476 [Suillus subaureus]|uniref:Uncharacterized protein n=1 Tax=Suillus subaureus TaxID=48587 RepID=A0A9P7E1I6_9AGAM|nr:uncharacterized protein BJ212DRAFT_1436476 [Suillus subaureus]KAG1808445.1 hypothetical protein BJ212DRAFT_1436476 [Suillus subaureus]
MGLALLAPDGVVAWAVRQWLWARHITVQFKEHFSARHLQEERYEEHDGNQALAEHTEVKPSGPMFLRQFHTLAEPFKEWFKAHFTEQPEDYTWTQTHSFFALMGGFMLYVDGEPYLTLSPDQLLFLIRAGSIDAPALTARQIRDRSKGNAISKGSIIIQGAWFILQLLSRVIYHLEITHIEVATLAFAVLNFISYAVWWNKPLDVQCPHPVHWKSAESNPEISFPRHMIGLSLVDSCLQAIGVDAMSPRKLRVPTFDSLHSIKLQPWESNVLAFAGLAVATIFGGINCIAWFYAFPTYQEQVLWRTSAITITCIPYLVFVVAFVLFRSRTRQRSSVRFTVFLRACFASYFTARILLLILMFTTLRNLSSDAYKVVSWTNLVPHL